MIISGLGIYKLMAWFHLIFGIVMFFVFTTTGHYMYADFPDKEVISPEMRILMRSRHIYILFNALIHISLGVYFRFGVVKWRKVVQIIGSITLVASSGLLLWAFITETYQYQQFSEISRFGIYTSLAGVILHLIGGLRKHER